MKWRYLSLLLSGVMALSVLTGCGSKESAPSAAAPSSSQSSSSGSSQTQPNAQATSDQPKRGGNLVFAHVQLPSSLDANVWTATNAARIMRQIYDPLVWQPEGGKFVPGLADKWEISPDGKIYTFTLRKGVKFHDGTPLNAAAVKFTFDRIADPKTKSLQSGRLGPYDRSEVVDEYTVKVYLKEPFIVFLSNLSEVALAPASPTAIQKLGDKYPLNPVATGPFKVKEWKDSNTLILERNPDYAWAPGFIQNKGTAYLDAITYKFVPEGATRLIALETGEAQIIDSPPPEDYKRLKESGKYSVHDLVVPGMPEMVNINVTNFPTSELAVRQAMQYGVDRKAMANLLFFGSYPAGQGLLTSGSWAYWKDVEKMYPYDPAKARKVLEDAGWKLNPQTKIYEKNGKPLRVRHVTTSGGVTQKAAEFVQGSLREIGFDYIVEAMAYEATVKRFSDNQYEAARLTYALIDPHDAFFLALHSSQITGGGQFNRSRVNDPKVDDLIRKGSLETSTPRRMEIYTELQKHVMEQAYILPGYENVLTHIMGKQVQGFKADLLGRPYLIDTWIKK